MKNLPENLGNITWKTKVKSHENFTTVNQTF